MRAGKWVWWRYACPCNSMFAKITFKKSQPPPWSAFQFFQNNNFTKGGASLILILLLMPCSPLFWRKKILILFKVSIIIAFFVIVVINNDIVNRFISRCFANDSTFKALSKMVLSHHCDKDVDFFNLIWNK